VPSHSSIISSAGDSIVKIKKTLVRCATVTYWGILAPVRYLAQRWLVRIVGRHARQHGGVPAEETRGIQALIGVMTSSQLIALANQYDAEGMASTALWFSRLAFMKSKTAGLTLRINMLAKHGCREELAALVDWLIGRPIQASMRYLQRALRIQDFIGTKGEALALARQNVHAYILAETRQSNSTRRNFQQLNILALNRWLADVEELATVRPLSESGRASLLGAVERSRYFMGEYYCLGEAANHNYLPRLRPEDFLCYHQGRIALVSETRAEKFVEFFLPFYFYIETETDKATRERICAMLRELLHSLEAGGAAIVPRHQFRLGNASPSGAWHLSMSYHTIGNRSHWWHVKDAALPGYFSIDKTGYSGWSSLADLDELPDSAKVISDAEVEARWRQLQDQFVAARVSKYPQSEQSFLAPKGRFIFLPLQVTTDTVAQLAWISTFQLAQLLVKLAPNLGYELVIKRHPKCADPRIQSFITRHRGRPHIHFTDASIHEILPKAHAVVTVNSGVGLEALLHGKPVITTGKSEYGFVAHKARSAEELVQQLSKLDEAMDQARIKRFLAWYAGEYLVKGDDRQGIVARMQSVLNAAPAGYKQTDSSAAPSSESAGMQDQDQDQDWAQLLKSFSGVGVRAWLDSGSLLGMVRHGHLNAWEKDVDLGVWISDFKAAQQVCRAFADKHGYFYRELRLRGIPYVILLDCLDASAGKLPLSVHVFYRVGETAWSPQPNSLAWGRAKYPRYLMAQSIQKHGNRLVGLLSFARQWPRHALAVIMDRMGLSKTMAALIKQSSRKNWPKGKHLADGPLGRHCFDLFQWVVPAHFFDHLNPLGGDQPSYALTPSPVEDYLNRRYGNWQVPVSRWFFLIDDGCIRPMSSTDFDQVLEKIRPLIEVGDVASNAWNP
jgi:hypothetical protein